MQEGLQRRGRLGIEALELKSLGYTSREIAERYSTTVNNVNALDLQSALQADERQQIPSRSDLICCYIREAGV